MFAFNYRKDTLFTVDTSTGAFRMTSSVGSFVEYLKYLHLFGETFGLHLQKKAPLAVEIMPAIEGLGGIKSLPEFDALDEIWGTRDSVNPKYIIEAGTSEVDEEGKNKLGSRENTLNLQMTIMMPQQMKRN